MSKKILIVDGDKEFVRSFEEVISNFEVELRVLGGVEAFNMIYGKEKFDLYIVSVELPDGNGFSLCKKIKENPVMKNQVVLIATPLNAESARKHQMSAGTKADAYFIKPINPKEFVGYIEEIMRTPLKRKKYEPAFSDLSLNIQEEKPVVKIPSPTVKEEIALEKELLERELKALKENIETLKGKTAILIREKEAMREKLESAERENTRFKTLLTEYEKNVNFYKEKASSAESKAREYEESISYYQKKMKEIEEQASFYKREYEGSISLYQKKLKEMEEQVSFYKRRNEEIEKRTKELEGELAFYRKKSEGAEMRLKEIEKEMNGLRELLEEKEKEKRTSLRELEATKNTISELKGEIAKKELEIENLRKNFSDFNEQIKAKDRKIAELELALSKLKEEKSMVEKTLGDLRKKNEEYEARIIEFQKELEERKAVHEEEIKRIEPTGEFKIGEGEIGEELEIPVAEVSEDEDITRAIDDFFTKTEFIPSKSFEETLEFMIESAREDLSSLTTSQEKIAQKLVKVVDIYNLVFRYIFDKIRLLNPDADPQKIFNDYFTDLSEEASSVYGETKFDEKGELNSFELSRNVMRFVSDMSIPKSEMDSTAVSIMSDAMADLLNFMKFTSANLLSDDDTEDIKEKVELLSSKVKSIERT